MLQRIRHCAPLALALVCGPATAAGLLPCGVVENRGQWAAEVRYTARCGPTFVIFEATSVRIHLRDPGEGIRMRFTGARPTGVMRPREPLPGLLHLFLGRDPARWRSNLLVHAELVYRDVWPGVDVVFRPEEGGLRYEVVAAAGVDPALARFGFELAASPAAAADGSVTLEEQHELVDRSISPDGSVRFLSWSGGAAAAATSAGDDVVSSTVSWSTFLGGLDNDYPHGLVVDDQDRPVVTGYTRSSNFPITPGAFDSTHSGSYDVFVAKLDAAGTSVLWATFLGGYGEDRPFALALGAGGDIVVAGHTDSPDFPTTAAAWDRSLGGLRDAFVARFDSTGSVLRWSTYLGGGGLDRVWGLAMGAGDRAVVAGETSSSDYPTTAGAFDRTLGGAFDAFVTKLEADGRGMRWSTLLGGAANDWAQALALDAMQRPLLVGTTCSIDFPVTPAAYDSTYHGGCDGFVARLAAAGDSLDASTYLGGAASDMVHVASAHDPLRVVVAGSTSSSDFAATPGAFDTTYGGAGDGFVAALDVSLSTLLWSTFLGGGDADEIFAMVVDEAGSILVSGETASADFPTTWDGFDRIYDGNRDAFVTRLAPAGEALDWSTFLGGAQWDSGWDFALDASCRPLLTGPTRSPDFPTTVGAFDRTYNGAGSDAFVLRLAITPVAAVEPVSASRSALHVVPNPSSAGMRLRLALSRAAEVQLEAFDAAGRCVAASTFGHRAAGTHELLWLGEDARGRRLAPGVYWLRVRAGEGLIHTKVVLLRR